MKSVGSNFRIFAAPPLKTVHPDTLEYDDDVHSIFTINPIVSRNAAGAPVLSRVIEFRICPRIIHLQLLDYMFYGFILKCQKEKYVYKIESVKFSYMHFSQ